MKTKHLFFALAAMMLLGATMPIQAQKKVKRTTTTKKKKPTTPLTNITTADFPATVDGHLAFCGISLAETPANMKAKLIELGMQEVSSYDDCIELNGMLDGVKYKVSIVKDYQKKIWNISVNGSYKLKQAKTHFQSLLSQTKTIYGSKFEKDVDMVDAKLYKFKVSNNGIVRVQMSNEDDMDGTSSFYYVSAIYQEEY